MSEDDKVMILRLVKDYFSSATDSDALLVWGYVRGYDRRDAVRAVEEHRLEKGADAWRPDPKRVKAIAHGYHLHRRREFHAAQRVVDYLRRQPESAELLHGLPDPEAVEAHYTLVWSELTTADVNDTGRKAMRFLAYANARHAFSELGLDRDESDRRARDCVGLLPGEVIPRVAPFQALPGPPPSSWDARRQLAAAGGEAA
jgi:hypothetical protein